MGQRVTTQVVKVRLETENFQAGRTAFQGFSQDITASLGKVQTFNAGLKQMDTAGKTSGNAFRNVTSQVQQLDRSTTSVAGKMKNFAGTFAGSITSVGALGGQVFNLKRQYEDLTDSQIRVDRTQLKMSRTAEAEAKARKKLQDLVTAGITSGAEYEQALTDVQQAQEAATLAVTMNKEALEDQARIYEDFAMNVLPTVLTAGSSVVNIFKEIGGTKGIGGLAEKIKGLSGLSGGIGGISKEFVGMAGAIGGAVIMAVKLFDVIQKGADIKKLQASMQKQGILGVSQEDYDKQIQQVENFKNDWATAIADVFRGGKMTSVYEGVIQSLKSEKGRADAAKSLHDTLDSIFSTHKFSPQTEAKIRAMAEFVYRSLGNNFNYAARKDSQGKEITAQAVTDWTNEALGLAVDKITGEVNFAVYGETIAAQFHDAINKGLIKQGGMTNISDRAAFDKALANWGGGKGPRIAMPIADISKTPFAEAKPVVEGFGDALAEFGQKATAAFAAHKAAADKLANSIKYLDSNFKPLNISIQQEEDALTAAEKALKAHQLALDPVAAGMDKATTGVADFMRQTKESVAGMDVWRKGLTDGIKEVTTAFGKPFQASTAFTIDQLKQLYEAALQGPQAFDALLKSLKETNRALWETGKAAPVAYGALFPAHNGIPKGGRSGKLRIRSDYVRPLIGSPESQRQMLAGTRPKEFARGSAEIAKLAAQIKIGDKMNQQADKYAQGVGKMTTANTNLKTSLGNMPASLIPVNQAVANIPANTGKATTAIGAMNQALKNIPKQTTPKVTAQVTGLNPVNQMNKALRNIPRIVTSTVVTRFVVQGQNVSGAAHGTIPHSGGPPRGPQAHFTGPKQHGYIGTVKRPTFFLAGEGHRPEDISIIPRGSRAGGGRGGGTIKIEIVPHELSRLIKASMTWGNESYR